MTVALADLTQNRWTVVARRVRVTAHRDGWEWELSPREVSILQIAVVHGSITLAQQRDANGQMMQVAKLASGQRREGERFAVAGIGMFEQ